MVFDNAGRLLISLGDGGNTPAPRRTPTGCCGKILRIDPATDAFPADAARDYSIPAANPFAAAGGLPEILAMGLRNPFRMQRRPVTGDIFIGDVGENAIEEVDRVAGEPDGRSSTLAGTCAKARSRTMAALTARPSPCPSPSTGRSGLTQGDSMTGGVVYRGPIEDLQGQYIFGDFGSNNLWSVPIANLVVGSGPAVDKLHRRRNTEFTPDAGPVRSRRRLRNGQ